MWREIWHDLLDQSTTAAKVATISIFIAVGFVTSVVLFDALGEPNVPIWVVIVATLIYVAGAFGLGKLAQRLPAVARVGYLLDLAAGLGFGVAFMCEQGAFAADTVRNNLASFVWAVLMIGFTSYFYLCRHARAERQ